MAALPAAGGEMVPLEVRADQEQQQLVVVVVELPVETLVVQEQTALYQAQVAQTFLVLVVLRALLITLEAQLAQVQ